jgi:hypothetical protein
LRLLLPRCRACRRYTLGLAHKILLFILGALFLYFLMATFLSSNRS